MADRTVHGRSRGGMEIVRYDKAGKWYLEGEHLRGIRGNTDRVRVSLDEAAFHAAQDGAEVYTGLAGGTRFDAAVRAWRA